VWALRRPGLIGGAFLDADGDTLMRRWRPCSARPGASAAADGAGLPQDFAMEQPSGRLRSAGQHGPCNRRAPSSPERRSPEGLATELDEAGQVPALRAIRSA